MQAVEILRNPPKSPFIKGGLVRYFLLSVHAPISFHPGIRNFWMSDQARHWRVSAVSVQIIINNSFAFSGMDFTEMVLGCQGIVTAICMAPGLIDIRVNLFRNIGWDIMEVSDNGISNPYFLV